MARQRPTRLVMGPCIVEIDCIVIREVQYHLEVNRCRNEEIIAWPMWAGYPRVGNGAMRKVQYQFEVNRCRNKDIWPNKKICNFGWAWPMWAGCPRIDHIVIREVQYQFEVNRCRNEEIIVKSNFGWAWPMWAGRPRIDRIVIREVQYQFEDNGCRNEEIIFQGSSANGRTDGGDNHNIRFSKCVGIKTILGGYGQLWAGRPRVGNRAIIVEIDRIVIRDVRNEEIIVKGNFGRTWPMCPGRPRVGNGAMHRWLASEIDCFVIREVQYQFEVNRCRNEEIIVKGNLGGRGLCGRGAPGLVMGPCIVEIDCFVIREVQYQFEVNRCRNEGIISKGNLGGRGLCGLGAPGLVMGPCIVEINCIVIRVVQYQFEVNRCRNEEIIVKGNFRWAWPMWAWPICGRGAPVLVMGPCIAEIDRFVIREVQYQFEVNQCRNEEIIVKGNFGLVWPMWAGRLSTDSQHGLSGLVMGPCIAKIDRIVIREVQYPFEVNLCRNEEIIVKGNFGWAWLMSAGRPRINRIVIREAQYQFEVNRCRNEEVNFQGSSANRRTD
ncbi:hypothetical protein DPMN_001648 [Dreissena polymorpha]|uniref:Uncharacterized protein n=1 Tax=Dreissena polymorpha TaxID=45954 RepID=A0A9D4RT35_DREPO|nr:hypothetical protein DPMN_001648 [Dreissena polymorpha]